MHASIRVILIREARGSLLVLPVLKMSRGVHAEREPNGYDTLGSISDYLLWWPGIGCAHFCHWLFEQLMT